MFSLNRSPNDLQERTNTAQIQNLYDFLPYEQILGVPVPPVPAVPPSSQGNCPYAYQYCHAFILLVQLVLLEPEQRGTSILAPTYENFVFILLFYILTQLFL